MGGGGHVSKLQVTREPSVFRMYRQHGTVGCVTPPVPREPKYLYYSCQNRHKPGCHTNSQVRRECQAPPVPRCSKQHPSVMNSHGTATRRRVSWENGCGDSSVQSNKCKYGWCQGLIYGRQGGGVQGSSWQSRVSRVNTQVAKVQTGGRGTYVCLQKYTFS